MATFFAFVHLARPFWFSRKRISAWLLLAAMLACALGFVRISLAINSWNKTFFDALAAFDAASVPALAILYAIYLLLSVAVIASGNWFMKRLAFAWRDWATQQFLARWLSHSNHYRLRLDEEPDNIDQRIAEDIGLLATQSLELFRSFILNVTRLAAFIAVLWTMSGVQELSLAGFQVRIPGYLVWLAMIYAALSTLLMHALGRSLIPLNVERQRREADFRATLIGVRDASEQVALLKGEPAETQRLASRFGRIRDNWQCLIGREFRLECFSAFQMRVGWFIPVFATLPLYLTRSFSLGDMMQAQNAFTSVLDGMSWFLNYYRRIVEWAAVVRRVSELDLALRRLEQRESLHTSPHTENQPHLLLKGLHLLAPDGQTLLANLTAEFAAPAHVLLRGPSGCGKTTLLRSLAGLWPHQHGNIAIGAGAFFLPQKPYLPREPLHRVLNYPCVNDFSHDRLENALRSVGLARLIPELGLDCDWTMRLSGGEQQRIGFARLLLHRAPIIVLDEATSHLDASSAMQMYRLLREELPESLVIAISHQQECVPHFDIVYDLGTAAPLPVELKHHMQRGFHVPKPQPG